jgi:hypothetical protein
VTPAALAPARDAPTRTEQPAESDDVVGAPPRGPDPTVEPSTSEPRGADRATDAPRSDDEHPSTDAPSVGDEAGAPHPSVDPRSLRRNGS